MTKSFLIAAALFFNLSSNAFATDKLIPLPQPVQTANVTLSTAMPNPTLAPLGQLYDVVSGEEYYVTAVISVLAPSELAADCIYEINFVLDSSVAYKAIRLVPPMNTVSCGQKPIQAR